MNHEARQPPFMGQLEKLIKVLALTSSDQDGEALAALRQAKHMLFSQGLCLADLAALLAVTPPATTARRPALDASRGLIQAYEARLSRLQHENEQLQKDLQAAEAATQRWRNLAESTERDSTRLQAAAEKWRDLARHTANHLWELGQQLHALDQSEPAAQDKADGHNQGQNIVTFQKPPRG